MSFVSMELSYSGLGLGAGISDAKWFWEPTDLHSSEAGGVERLHPASEAAEGRGPACGGAYSQDLNEGSWRTCRKGGFTISQASLHLCFGGQPQSSFAMQCNDLRKKTSPEICGEVTQMQYQNIVPGFVLPET